MLFDGSSSFRDVRTKATLVQFDHQSPKRSGQPELTNCDANGETFTRSVSIKLASEIVFMIQSEWLTVGSGLCRDDLALGALRQSEES